MSNPIPMAIKTAIVLSVFALTTATVAVTDSRKPTQESMYVGTEGFIKSLGTHHELRVIRTDGLNSEEYPSIEDAAIITNIPVEDIYQAILFGTQIDGDQFQIK